MSQQQPKPKLRRPKVRRARMTPEERRAQYLMETGRLRQLRWEGSR